ncbi:methyltransferase domain-containing protein [Candidatus Babeliales bacterium]|nr:methyltransferase domain-containing protein [Candidatus Babeliales bacterium]
MSVFGAYAQYYDALYHDKNYQAETAYLDALIKKFAPQACSILELGCGTGRHALELAQKGYAVHGIDISQEMLTQAQALRVANSAYEKQLSFSHADLRTVRLEKKFDVVASLFHVMSYQTTDCDLRAAFQTAAAHLNAGGLFIFDFWYGPAVLTQGSQVRVKRIETECVKVTRVAEPESQEAANCVNVNFTIFVHDKKDNTTTELHEKHAMRYLFKPEVEALFAQYGFECVAFEEWLTGKQQVSSSWGVCAVGRKL